MNDNATGTWTSGVPIEPVPSDNSTSGHDASTNGCVYQGPTTITLNGAANTMTVNSPGTRRRQAHRRPGDSRSNDPLNAAANTANLCMPAPSVGTVAVPANGVVYVEGARRRSRDTAAQPRLRDQQNYDTRSRPGARPAPGTPSVTPSCRAA